MSLTRLQYSQCSKCTDRTMESVYATVQSVYPQCAAGMQFIWNRCCCKSGRM